MERGYNILWGITQDKLYQTYQVWVDEATEREIRALNIDVRYYFAIEAFNMVSSVSEVLGAIEKFCFLSNPLR